MVDGHIHLERGNYTLAWLNEFVKVALERGITEIHLLEHSHRFYEFEKLYDSVITYSDYQKAWLSRHLNISLEAYQNFITEMRKKKFPIKIEFGLEVCYIEGTEEIVKHVLSGYDWDFVTGSVHWIDGFGFDHKKEFWKGKDVNHQYIRYYEIMKNLIKSDLYTTVAHPDSIKCFGYNPSIDLTETYMDIADLLLRHHMSAEMSAGLHNNYGCEELGMSPQMLSIFKKAGVELLTVSDAHKPDDVGRCIKEMEQFIAMKYEKSCGAVVYHTSNNKIEFLSIKSRKFGHWGFPKGHVENGESEQETAIREIYEETGLQMVIQSEFKQTVEYPLSSNAHKEVVYFIAESSGQPITIQQEEVQDYKWLDFNGAYQLLSYKNDKDVLEAVNTYLINSI